MKAKGALLITVLGLIALLLTGCTTPYGEPNYTGTGALIGGVSGAGLGAVAAHHEPAAGALVGGAIGAVAGGLIGHSMEEPRPPVYAAAPPPAPRYVWANGQWLWNGSQWVWAPGHWVLVQ